MSHSSLFFFFYLFIYYCFYLHIFLGGLPASAVSLLPFVSIFSPPLFPCLFFYCFQAPYSNLPYIHIFFSLFQLHSLFQASHFTLFHFFHILLALLSYLYILSLYSTLLPFSSPFTYSHLRFSPYSAFSMFLYSTCLPLSHSFLTSRKIGKGAPTRKPWKEKT